MAPPNAKRAAPGASGRGSEGVVRSPNEYFPNNHPDELSQDAWIPVGDAADRVVNKLRWKLVMGEFEVWRQDLQRRIGRRIHTSRGTIATALFAISKSSSCVIGWPSGWRGAGDDR